MALQLQCVVAAVDMSPASKITVFRAAKLASNHGVVLRVVNVGLLRGAFRAPEFFDVAALARQAAERFNVQVEVLKECASGPSCVARHVGPRGLIVMSHERQLSLRSLWRGSLAEQILRIAESPVLVVKSRSESLGNYRKVVVAVDLTAVACDLVRLAHSLDVGSALQILHSIRPLHPNPLRDAEIPQRVLQAYLIGRKKDAREHLLQLASGTVKCEKVETVLREGDPALHTALQQSHSKADLVVVGKRRASALSDALRGSVAKRTLTWCEGDILVVPYEPSSDKSTSNCTRALSSS